MTVTLLFLTLTAAVAFQTAPTSRQFAYESGSIATNSLALTANDASVAIRASDLDDALGLTPEERAVVNVHRVCSKSVVYVTSVLKPMGSWRRAGIRNKKNDEVQKKQPSLPRGTALGSGSGFVVDPAGYIVTNYHVIQRAYESNQNIIQYETFWNGVVANATNKIQTSGGDSTLLSNMQSIINGTISAIPGSRSNSDNLPAQVFVRFGTDGGNGVGGYQPCDIVDVVKELDVAVLKICDPSSTSTLPALMYGSSSDLLVGQSLLAIGNPFGLDRTLTAGLVSALDRSVTGVVGNDIKNCIQTDAAINPGNSGGPLLTLNGKVVGVNTMIITTSGSSAGIGFAVPGDNVKERTDYIVEMDKERQLRLSIRKGRGWLGLEVAMNYLEDSFRQRLVNADGLGAFVTAIDANSPVLHTQNTKDIIKMTTVVNGSVKIGDRIIKVGGTDIANGKEFANEMKKRVEGEQINMTVVNEDGDTRIVYIKLGRIPL